MNFSQPPAHSKMMIARRKEKIHGKYKSLITKMSRTAIIITSLYLTIINLALVHSLVQNGPVESEGEDGLVFRNPSSIKPNDDPENTLDIVEKARNNEISAEMVTNKTRAMISCETGEILVRINFTEPFRGVAYANYDRSSPCKFFGEGGNYYEMRLPLKGCGTKQEATRLFINNIVLRFHRSLELEEDEEKTIVCRYPPPNAPSPPPAPGLPAKIINAPPEPAKLTQYEPFVIIAGLLFFALLLAGIGTTSYVTRKQTLKPINTALPITAQNDYDIFTNNNTVIETEEIDTNQKLVPFPKLSTQLVDDIFTTRIDEIEVIEELKHHRVAIPKSQIERQELDDMYITNQDEITEEEVLHQRRLADMRRLGHLGDDDVYITNQDEIIEDEELTQHRLRAAPSKLELRTIEDTFITKTDEVVEIEDQTTYLKNQENHCEEYESYQGYRKF